MTIHRNRLIVRPVTNKSSSSLKTFGDVSLNHVFWDPFVNRTFVKVSSHEAGCLVYPEKYTQQFVPFDPEEKVYIIGPKPKSQIVLMTLRQAALIKSYKQRRIDK